MSYIVEQKIKGNIYLYRVESYWDKDKKQSRQKRTYLGPKNRRKKGNKSRKLALRQNLWVKIVEATAFQSISDSA